MNSARFCILIFGIFIFAFSSLIYAGVPQMINYQGKVTTPSGALVDTSVQMIFTIYDDSTTGNVLWADTISSVSVQKGIFSVLLGSGNPIPDSVFDGNVRYLGTKVGTDAEMSPRKAMVSVAYAYRAGTADGGGGADNDWTFRITDTADTTLITGGEWGIARYGNTLFGNADSTHVNFGLTCTTGTSGEEYKYCTVGGGLYNTAGHNFTTVSGGRLNDATGLDATVGGGFYNIASGTGASISGGNRNEANGGYATVSGGSYNSANAGHATVGGGVYGSATAFAATIGGGYYNVASGARSTVGGGDTNIASDNYTTIGGGFANEASSENATVGGGFSNEAIGHSSTIGGGNSNLVIGEAGSATIGGGSGNVARGSYATIGGGAENTASGYRATIPGGYADTAAGDYSLAAGSEVRISAGGDYTFAFGRDFSTSTPNAVIFHNSHDPIKVGIGTSSPGVDLDIASTSPNLRLTGSSGGPVITLDKPAGGYAEYLEFREGGASKWQAGVSTTNDYYILNWPASKYVFFANSTGNVGIGTTSPDEELHVVGNIKMVDGNQATGYVLTSDANGVGTWQAASGGGIGGSGTTNYLPKFTGSTTLGNSVFYEGGGRIGLGTISPGADLDIVSTNPNLRLGTTSGSPVITLDKASGYTSILEFREAGASKWQAGVSTTNDYYILNWPASQYVFYANAAGDVGIGTTNPSEKLTVNGDIDMIQGQSRIHGTGEISFDWSAGSTYDDPSQHGFESKDEAGTWGDEIRINSMNDIINTVDANDNDATSYFKVQHHSTGDGEDLFWVRSSDGYAYHKGRLGIGTTSPGVDLDIVSTNPNLRLSTASGSPVVTLDKASGYWGYLEFRDGGASKWQAGVTSGNDYYILNWPASKYVFYANSAGNVGMGTTSPTSPLDVNGNDIRIRSSQTPASASADGYTGEVAWDANYIYICISGDGPGGGTDSWKRAALSTW